MSFCYFETNKHCCPHEDTEAGLGCVHVGKTGADRAPSSALGTEHRTVILTVTLGKGWGEVGRWEKAAFSPANTQENPRGSMNGARRTSTLVQQTGLIPHSAPHSLHKLSQYSCTLSFHFLICKMTLNSNIYHISVMKIR